MSEMPGDHPGVRKCPASGPGRDKIADAPPPGTDNVSKYPVVARALAFFLNKWANSSGWGHISCLNAPGWGQIKRANAPPLGSSPSNTSAVFFLLISE